MSEPLSEQRMDIFLLAAPQAGIEHSVLVSNLAAAFKKDAAAIEKMLSRPRTMVKADVTPEIADKYKVLIEKSGGQCELVVREPVATGARSELAAPATAVSPAADTTSVPPAAPIPAVTPVPAVAPELITDSEQTATPEKVVASHHHAAPEKVVVEATPASQTNVSLQADQAEAAVDKQSEFAQVQALASELLANENQQKENQEKESQEKGETYSIQHSSTQYDRGQDDGERDTSSDAICYCVKCGTLIRVGQTRCPKCYTPVTEYQSKNKTTASLLALFLGGLGVHRLYLGQWWGVIYLVFFWTLIPIVVAVIEAAVFWYTPQHKWNAHYGRVQSSSGLLAGVFVVAFVILMSFITILVAFVMPRYQDYTYQADVQSSMPLVQSALNKVATYIKQNQTYPDNNQMLGLPENSGDQFIESINVQRGAIVQVVYRLSGSKENNMILWIPTEIKGEIIWDCKRGTLPDKYRPKECRSDDTTINKQLEKAAAESALAQKVYSKDRHLSLLVPITWQESELLPEAVLGAAKLLDENYVVVLADPKANFDENLPLADYSRTVQLHLAENIKDGMVQGDVEYLTIAGFPAEQFIFNGVVGGVKTSYLVTLIHGDTHFYRVLAWTLRTRMDTNKELLKRISESIKTY